MKKYKRIDWPSLVFLFGYDNKERKKHTQKEEKDVDTHTQTHTDQLTKAGFSHEARMNAL